MKVEQVVVDARGVQLPGELAVPSPVAGLVIFAHGSDSSRHSPRNKYVAQVLDRSGLGTLLFDLLTPEEARDRRNVFDIPLLAERLTAAHGWARQRPGLGDLPVGYFGASTGGAAAVWSAGSGLGDGVGDGGLGRASDVGAVVSRGGRVDLAGPQLGSVTAPTLLVVGELDADVLRLNREAQQRLRCTNRLEIVAGATHLFTEPGTLERVAELARDWFRAHL
ncbi:dienelactone hydrolase [Kribbella sp. VKM Ac-2571]|uniref:dienelactone hydrolase family protein n=1 Tax=Kribbella sp. VKM Ac-2571 TaxID=2512222 RepID=UPI00105B4A8E|nr:alpha/beta hydrolase [Kribbella sp. VKM Ac-2571]TDO44834.1 dienelactone hydrolase [Kribbella sp. VKM Ac-2571]